MQSEIDHTVVPGASHLIDMDHVEEGVAQTKESIVLIPTASDDPNIHFPLPFNFY
ncbi:uncharacterized protein OGAPODRAFT_16377 [Ogataea polymorpha]|uniref:uncharacterized protein n=1 Tax=Ogataea polymorpha TaxID=460523 RepID=UPI0007F37A5F|nr:uncharacterized protein OGAPODRAFT_16377 [Ogataea polymorpha]OBA16923.1 hypothetical protein OGAPODRAFT_16377 [Ogataea polymorpha]